MFLRMIYPSQLPEEGVQAIKFTHYLYKIGRRDVERYFSGRDFLLGHRTFSSAGGGEEGT